MSERAGQCELASSNKETNYKRACGRCGSHTLTTPSCVFAWACLHVYNMYICVLLQLLAKAQWKKREYIRNVDIFNIFIEYDGECIYGEEQNVLNYKLENSS